MQLSHMPIETSLATNISRLHENLADRLQCSLNNTNQFIKYAKYKSELSRVQQPEQKHQNNLFALTGSFVGGRSMPLDSLHFTYSM